MNTRHPVHPNANLRPSACIGEILSRIGRGELPCAEEELSKKDLRDFRDHCYDARDRFVVETKKKLEAGQNLPFAFASLWKA